MSSKKRKIIQFTITLVFLFVSDLTAHADCWYNTSWSHRIKIRVVRSRVRGSHVDFPAYFNLNNLSATNFFSRVRANGGDIRITRSDGKTELAREIVAINTGTSTGEIHFKIPFLSGGEEFYIYYGNPIATDYAVTATYGAQNVWTNSYLAVWHLNNDPAGGASSIRDSTVNARHGTPQNGLSTADLISGAKVGSGMNFDGNNERIDIPSGLSTNISGNSFSFCAWDRRDAAGVEDWIWGNTVDGPNSQHLHIGYRASNVYALGFWSNDLNTTATFTTTGVWRHWYATYDTTINQQVVYFNGGFLQSRTSSGDLTGTKNYQIGSRSNSAAASYDGIIDEIRFASVVRNANWIRTEFNNQNNPSSFWTVSAEDAQGTQWYGCAWKQRKIIRVVPAQVTGTQTNYPAYFDLNDLVATNFFNEVRTDGADIRITQCDGTTELAREIVSIDTVNGTGELHFLIPSMSGGEEFFIYYGNPSATNYARTAPFGSDTVWSDYLSVYHLNQNPAGIAPQMIDSTNNGIDGTSVGAMTITDSVAGQLGQALDFDGANDYIGIPNTSLTSLTGTSSLTASAWTRSNTANWNAFGFIASIRDVFIIHPDTGGRTISFYVNSGGWVSTAFTPANIQVWHKYDMTYNGSRLTGFLDGVNTSSIADTGNFVAPITQFFIGADTLGGRFGNAQIDEVRVTNMARNSNWLSTEFNNQNNPGIFWDLTVVDDTLQIISFTPTDNGTAASVTANLEILFDKVPTILNGDLIIRRISNDSAFQSFDTNGTTFTVSGNSVRLRLTNPLFYNEYYYVELGCGAFGPIIGAHFPGFNDNGTWNFYSGGMEEEIDFFGKNFRF
jgi:hypothetical protein